MLRYVKPMKNMKYATNCNGCWIWNDAVARRGAPWRGSFSQRWVNPMVSPTQRLDSVDESQLISVNDRAAAWWNQKGWFVKWLLMAHNGSWLVHCVYYIYICIYPMISNYIRGKKKNTCHHFSERGDGLFLLKRTASWLSRPSRPSRL